ncbi:hypothetical protein, partial [Mesorhizobium sp.]|uniref:hypothetical protein n=1 Tax=Mesorhizobium sp. TaxID=1871066 RepID=UPI0025EEBE63
SGGTESGPGTTLAQGGAAFNGSFGLDGGRVLQLGGSSTATGYVYLDLNASDPNTGVSDVGAGALTIGSGATLNDQSDGGLYIYANNWGPGDDGSAAAVNNAGTFVKSGVATTSTIATRFNNTGSVDVESGTLSLSGGGIDVGATYQGAGTVNFSGGTRMLDAASSITGNATFSGGTTTIAGTVSAQFLSVISGTVIFDAATTTGALSQSGGELNGSGQLTVTGLATLSGGTESGPGTTLAQGGAAFNGSFGLDGGRVLQLGGSSTAAGYIYLDLNASDPNTGVSDAGSGALTISSGATFDDQSDGGLYIYANNWGPGDDGSAAAVNNAGTFVKSGVATTSTIATRFNNTGLVDVESGTL